ncbi:hypothetical protein SHXM_01824 [Streptomyces hygroscopicus]|nr:hypothetical protein SHXM_01824 [Streptomyces hygroscopicus]
MPQHLRTGANRCTHHPRLKVPTLRDRPSRPTPSSPTPRTTPHRQPRRCRDLRQRRRCPAGRVASASRTRAPPRRRAAARVPWQRTQLRPRAGAAPRGLRSPGLPLPGLLGSRRLMVMGPRSPGHCPRRDAATRPELRSHSPTGPRETGAHRAQSRRICRLDDRRGGPGRHRRRIGVRLRHRHGRRLRGRPVASGLLRRVVEGSTASAPGHQFAGAGPGNGDRRFRLEPRPSRPTAR